MGTFSASLRTIGDVSALPATVQLEDGHLSIAAGTTEIGTWPLAEIHLEPIPTGYRMAAEGEQILIELKDVDSFQEALQNGKKRRKRFRKRAEPDKSATPAPAADETPAPAPAPAREPEPVPRAEPVPAVQPRSVPERNVALPPRDTSSEPSPKSKPKTTGFTEKGLAFVDGTLHKANKRFGPYLPEWVFTRLMFGIAFVALVLMVVLPGLVSIFLLVAGALIVVFGAIVYSDPMLASRWLPGRTQPPHVLLFGVAILMMGVLLGVIAR